jgi:hypothetical protein
MEFSKQNKLIHERMIFLEGLYSATLCHGGVFFGTHFQYGYIVSKLSKVIIVFSTSNTDSHDINKISLTVALNSQFHTNNLFMKWKVTKS